jgi:hypothetical protein
MDFKRTWAKEINKQHEYHLPLGRGAAALEEQEGAKIKRHTKTNFIPPRIPTQQQRQVAAKPKMSSSHASVQQKKRGSEGERKRREHAAKILSSQRESDDREFICLPKFLNSLPNIPSGPFFRTTELPHSSADFAIYTVSTLEKSFIWQPHQVGLNLDLVDQEAILAVSDKSVHPSDARFLADRRTNVNIPDRIPWLKRTTYLTNDLYDNVNKFKGGEALEKGFKERKILSTGDKINPFDQNFISRSFDVVSQKTKDLEKESSQTRHIEWVAPIFPQQDEIWSQNLSLVSYLEDIYSIPLKDSENMTDDEIHARKRQRISQSIISNIRRTEGRDESVAASLVVASESPSEYDWLKDFKMDIKASKLLDHYELVIRPNGECVYCPLRAKIELKKIDPRLSIPHRASVVRRDPLTNEIEESDRLLSEIRE